MTKLTAVVLAAGRICGAQPDDPPKALLEIGNRRLFDVVLDALKGSEAVERLCVVAPRAMFEAHPAVDAWIEERGSDAGNVMAALASVPTGRVVLSASDLPFVTSADVDDFVRRVPDDVDIAYPVYTRDEFLACFPGGRRAFARVGASWWTGGSLCVVRVEALRAHADLVRRAFRARKEPMRLAGLLGVRLLVRHVAGILEPGDVAARVGELMACRALAVRGAPPSLAFDCDSPCDVEYAVRKVRGSQ